MLSGHKQIDHLLHTIIDYILRDYIESWFNQLTENKEFSEYRVRTSIEESVQNVCNRWVFGLYARLSEVVIVLRVV